MKKRRLGLGIFVTTLLLVIGYLIVPFFDESVTGGQTFFKIAATIVLAFAVYAISTAFEGK